MRAWLLTAILACLLVAGLSVAAPDALAFRLPLEQESNPDGEKDDWLLSSGLENLPTPGGQIEGACGVAPLGSSHDLYVSDYYHRAIHRFTFSGQYQSTQVLAGGDPEQDIDTLDAVCGLAIDAAGNLYANEFHQRVLRMPGEEIVDSGESTGVAVDGAGDLYVDDRTYVAVYDAPVEPGEEPAEKIGLGSLGDAYGVAVDANGTRIYVPDAATQTIEIFEPAVSLAAPVDTIAGPEGTGEVTFHSLVNAAVAVDPSKTGGEGHLLVVDDVQPFSLRPQAAIYEFDSEGNYLDTLARRTVGPQGEETSGPIFGEPSGIAVDAESGDLFVTTGNSEDSNVVAYGPYEATAPPLPTPGGEEAGASPGAGALTAQVGAASGSAAVPVSPRGGGEAVIVRRGPVQVSFNGKLNPNRLPRHGAAPVGIAIEARISATGSGSPPQLRRISIAINRNGHFVSTGLAACRVDQIQPSTTQGALAACGDSLVGEGHFSADVKLPEQSPFPSEGKVLAFNGRVNGRPAILAHIYGTEPAPTSAVLPFLLRSGGGTYGTTLEASLPQATGSWGYVTGLRMSLRRRFSYRGRARSYLSAGCPAPSGFPSAVFPLARTSFAFAGGPTLVSVLNRTCTAKG